MYSTGWKAVLRGVGGDIGIVFQMVRLVAARLVVFCCDSIEVRCLVRNDPMSATRNSFRHLGSGRTDEDMVLMEAIRDFAQLAYATFVLACRYPPPSVIRPSTSPTRRVDLFISAGETSPWW